MSASNKAIEKAISRLRDDFITQPADFNVEKSFQSRLTQYLLDQLDPSRATVSGTNADEVRQPQVKRTLEEAERIQRVREEAQFLDNDIVGAVDVVVLSPEAELHMVPAKKYRKEDTEAAIALKFVKTNASIYSGKKAEINEQIQRLNDFGPTTATFFLVFAVKDVFSEQQDLLDEFSEKLDGQFEYHSTPMS